MVVPCDQIYLCSPFRWVDGDRGWVIVLFCPRLSFFKIHVVVPILRVWGRSALNQFQASREA